ncbi:hypothetical protein CVU37_13885 [candidate division BRC1 bacterium HGW-BRC1-1]|nr:MAG: hypothetical protein CVU37_13885 [candidate division BRC1 bacterium HGW-BRC1-1]
MLCAVNQAAYLLRRLMEQQGRAFLEEGGFTERLYSERVKARATKNASDKSDQSDKSDMSDPSDKTTPPPCPNCHKPMRRCTARRGPHAGQSFWGCTSYPACRGTRPCNPEKPPMPDPSGEAKP